MADHNLFLVFTNAVSGQDADFNDWYERTHVPDVLAVPGVESARRYELAPIETPEVEGAPSPPPPVHRYLTVYELSRDANDVMAEFSERVASGAMPLSDTLDLDSAALSAWRPITDRQFAPTASAEA